MHEDGFELALEEVQQHHPNGHDLHITEWSGGVLSEEGGWVDVWSQWSGEKRYEEEWPGILDEVDCAPGDLWTEILDVDGRGRSDALVCEKLGSTVLDNGFCGWIHDGEAVVVAHPGGAREELLDLVNGGGGGNFKDGWEVADGFLARCGNCQYLVLRS